MAATAGIISPAVDLHPGCKEILSDAGGAMSPVLLPCLAAGHAAGTAKSLSDRRASWG